MSAAAHSRRATLALQKLSEMDPALAALALWCAHADADGVHDRAWTDGKTIFYAPGFEGLSLPEQMGLCAHHILHVAFRHVPRAKAMQGRLGDRFDADTYNIAADAILNETLSLAGYALPRPAVTVTALARDLRALPDAPAEAMARLDADRLYMLLIEAAGAVGGGASPEDEAARQRQLVEGAEGQGYRRDMETAGATPDPESEGAEAAEWRQRVVRALEEGRRAGRGIGALGVRLGDLPEAVTPWARHRCARGPAGRSARGGDAVGAAVAPPAR